MGHRDYKTTLIYADYAPRAHERALLEQAFAAAQPSSTWTTANRPAVRRNIDGALQR